MTMSDPLGDMLTRIRNGQRASKSVVTVPASKLRSNVLEVLQREGYIRGFSWAELRPGIAELTVELKYFEGRPVIDEIKRISKPGLRIYRKKDELPKVLGGLGIAIISTSEGVMSDRAARSKGCGGEVLCVVS